VWTSGFEARRTPGNWVWLVSLGVISLTLYPTSQWWSHCGQSFPSCSLTLGLAMWLVLDRWKWQCAFSKVKTSAMCLVSLLHLCHWKLYDGVWLAHWPGEDEEHWEESWHRPEREAVLPGWATLGSMSRAQAACSCVSRKCWLLQNYWHVMAVCDKALL
jgi:hypothetical protein